MIQADLTCQAVAQRKYNLKLSVLSEWKKEKCFDKKEKSNRGENIYSKIYAITFLSTLALFS